MQKCWKITEKQPRGRPSKKQPAKRERSEKDEDVFHSVEGKKSKENDKENMSVNANVQMAEEIEKMFKKG